MSNESRREFDEDAIRHAREHSRTKVQCMLKSIKINPSPTRDSTFTGNLLEYQVHLSGAKQVLSKSFLLQRELQRNGGPRRAHRVRRARCSIDTATMHCLNKFCFARKLRKLCPSQASLGPNV